MKFLKVAFIFFLVSTVNAQVTQQWVARYNGPGNGRDYARAIAVDDAGNVYVTGESSGSGTGLDYCTIKYNPSGVQQWVARYNGPASARDYAQAIAVDREGNVYVTGSSSGGNSYDDYATVKYGPDGEELWVARYNGTGNWHDRAFSLAVDDSGNVYVTGFSSSDITSEDFVTIKYNTAGQQQWLARYDRGWQDWAYALVLDSARNVYVTGFSDNGSDYDYATVKYNAAGVQQWAAIYQGPANNWDEAFAIALDRSGNVYVTGQSWGLGGAEWDCVTIKYNAQGAEQWVARYNGSANTYDQGLFVNADITGNVYVTGWATSSGSGIDFLTLRYNSSGQQQWAQLYNGPGGGADNPYGGAVDPPGVGTGVYIVGRSFGSGTSYDYAVVKYDTTGTLQWVAHYDGPAGAADEARAVAIDRWGNVYVTGGSTGSGSGSDYATIKYVQGPVFVDETEIPCEFVLHQNYPNPFNPTTTIRFAIPVGTRPATETADKHAVSLRVYDVLGREVATLVNEVKQPGRYSVVFDAGNLPSGVYFSTLAADGFRQTKKLLLIK